MYNVTKACTFLLITFFLLADLQVKASDISDKELAQHIHKQNEKFVAAFNRGDAEAANFIYTEDAVFMPPNAPAIRGREALLAANVADFKGPKRTLSITSVQISKHGDIAYEIGSWAIKIEPEGAETIHDNGDFLVIWKRQKSGDWLIHVDIINSNNPLPQ